MTITKDGIIQNLQKHRNQLKEFGVNQLGLFGSVVKGNLKENSDLDFFVVFDPDQKTFRNFMELSFFLEDLFEHKIDLVTPESLSPHFGSKILREVEYVSFS
ncbi:nucleotidyltransferase family protein [Dactylococcopsis salina]|uniref:Nucleotidyltransferase n=1 Tax=Dactylococcopsis salina (strain PCC 8305) TaxID=13035 RepID=K9YR18_DACS8|nr:nucleotidyltransferase family protein [Dactylococcopsis salina]AFZ48917.1 putative nucleotidyltransferase [Dactylococcopsis salina PCC 8305]